MRSFFVDPTLIQEPETVAGTKKVPELIQPVDGVLYWRITLEQVR